MERSARGAPPDDETADVIARTLGETLARGRRLAREASWVAAGQLGTIALRLVGLKIVTTLLSPESYGELVVLLTLAALAGTVLFQPLQQAALRFYADAEQDRRIDALRTLTGIPLLWAGGVFAIIFMFGSFLWRGFLHEPGSVTASALVVLLTVAEMWRGLESNFLNAARRQGTYAALSLIESVLRALAPLAFVRWFGPSSASVLAAYFASCLTTTFAFRGSFVRGERRSASSEIRRAWVEARRPAYRRFVLPLVPFAALGWIVGAADRPLIAALGGLEAAGIYGAVYGLASQPFLASTGIGVLTFRPILFAASSAGAAERERRLMLAWLAAQGAAGGIGWCALTYLAVPIVHLATGREFWSGTPLVPWIAGAYAIQGLQIVLETRMYAHRRTKSLLVLQVVGALAAMGFYAALIPRQGGLGAARATLAAMAASFLAAVTLSVRRVAADGNAPGGVAS